MEIIPSGPGVLHLTHSPGILAWGGVVGIMSIGFGAAYYGAGDHVILEVIFLLGCFILGLTFLDDWEHCVFDRGSGEVRLVRQGWWERLTSTIASTNTLILDSTSIMAVKVTHTSARLRNGYQVTLVLRSGGTVPISDTQVASKEDQERVARKVRSFLCLDRVESLTQGGASWGEFSDTDDDDNYRFPFFNQPHQEVESLKGSGKLNFEEMKLENEHNDSDSEESGVSGSSTEDDDPNNFYQVEWE